MNLHSLELKQRCSQISDVLAEHLPNSFERSTTILLQTLAPENECEVVTEGVGSHGLAGWAIMLMTELVGRHGKENFELSMSVLKEMTKRFSSEFDVRVFVNDDPKRALSIMKSWVRNPNRHVRRLVSEGTRPRFPWAIQLPVFVEDLAPVLSLLEKLKDDEEEYVRRSVANNLNDIAKDHPDVVAQVARDWLKAASAERKKLVHHGCRTLIKQGHKKTLSALGYRAPAVKLKYLNILSPQVVFGDALLFELSLISTSKRSQPLIIDYAIHHRKANGGFTRKIFKWKVVQLESQQLLTVKRKHSIRKITTRVYYPGGHRLEILVNGVSLYTGDFAVVM
ncbi:MAG: DNA alkylation repair protein [Granulosicoccus sp.]